MSLSLRKTNVKPNGFAVGHDQFQLAAILYEALAGFSRLSKADRRLVASKYLDNKSDRQIAQQLGMTPTRLKRQLDKAIETVVLTVSNRGNETRAKTKTESNAETSAWTTAKGDRRAELVDKDIDATLTPEERQELEVLQREMRAYRRAFAPLPIEAARALQAQLLSDIEKSP